MKTTQKTAQKTTQKTTQKITHKTTRKIVTLIMKNPKVSRRELSQLVGISEDGVKFQLDKLKRKGIIERIGPDKGGYWNIKE